MKKILVILGPTSTGKTDLALRLAKKFNGKLISADSRQVYKFLDVGAGKMPGNVSSIKYQVSRERGYWIINGIKIWMYDVVEPKTKFNLYKYILKAEEIIKKISEGEQLPILVGGTGLYIRSLLEGISDFSIGEDKKLREGLEKLSIEEIRGKINPLILSSLNNSEVNNKRRLIRIFEKLSMGSSKQSFAGIGENFDILKIGLKTDRTILRERIKIRLLSRIDQGMLEESKNLIARGILTYGRMYELGLEYKYIAKFLKGEIKTLEDLIEVLTKKIGQFAKRQETWFKKENDVFWFDISEKDFMEKVEKIVKDWYNSI